uniref:Uncharacterized protein n=1 Tax=Lotharella oceanica TaxID=641309 RepID=A0A7S2X810_9EUKA|mmetsp:Transcript_18277/g.34584  ORF Transcript_18277/g.34584 Transcript_18277/m.34584 type:complete len:216 (+) Transcript_18277:56-703(+)
MNVELPQDVAELNGVDLDPSSIWAGLGAEFEEEAKITPSISSCFETPPVPVPTENFDAISPVDNLDKELELLPPGQRVCPSCRTSVDCTGNFFQNHLIHCLLVTIGRQRTKTQEICTYITDIKKCISKLDFRKRISIMESLHRLSSKTAKPISSGYSPVIGQHRPMISTNSVVESDNQVLAMLYTVRQPQTRRSHRHSDNRTRSSSRLFARKFRR